MNWKCENIRASLLAVLLFGSVVFHQNCFGADVPTVSAPAPTDVNADDATIQKLIKQLKDEDASVRSYAVDALGLLDAKEAIPELIACLKDENNSKDLRRSSVRALMRLDAKEAIPELIARLEDINERVRAMAAYTLGQLDAKIAIPELTAHLNDQQASMREAVVSVLGRLDVKDVIPQLLAHLKDHQENTEVREAAAGALGQLGAKDASPELLACLNERMNPYLRSAAAGALGALYVREAIPELTQISKNDPVRAVRILTTAMLASLGENVEAEIWNKLTIHQYYTRYRIQAHALFAKLKIKSKIPELKKLSVCWELAERYAAKAALKQLEEK